MLGQTLCRFNQVKSGSGIWLNVYSVSKFFFSVLKAGVFTSAQAQAQATYAVALRCCTVAPRRLFLKGVNYQHLTAVCVFRLMLLVM